MIQSKFELLSLEGGTPAQEKETCCSNPGHSERAPGTSSTGFLWEQASHAESQPHPTPSAASDLHFHRVPAPESWRASTESHAAAAGTVIFQFLV